MNRLAFVVLVVSVLLHVGCSGCTCVTSSAPPVREKPIACVSRHGTRPTKLRTSEIQTISAGSLSGTFSTTSTGDARFVIPLRAPPGRARIEPSLSVVYNSSAGDGVLGVGFALAGAPSAITRCSKSLAQDGEIRGVRYDGEDKLCLDGKPLAEIRRGAESIEYRTVPDTFAKVIGHDPDLEGTPRSFEVLSPSGLVVAYGTDEGSRPLGPGGATQAWLAAEVHDGRGNAMTYGYCFADAGEYTAEYALDEIRYTRFDGSPSQEASRAVKLVYGTKDAAAVRTLFSGGMQLQSSLRLEAIQMVGPGEELVRSYAFTYGRSPTTDRTLLRQVEECGGDGVCLPPTRFDYASPEVGFRDRSTGIAAPTSVKASPLLLDMDADGLTDLVVPDTDEALSTPSQPITRWFVAHNRGGGESTSLLAPVEVAYSQEDVSVADPTEPADPTRIQPEIGTAIDYDQDGRKDVLIHDVHSTRPTWRVLLARADRTFEAVDTGVRRPFPLHDPPLPPVLATRSGSMHLADVDGDRVPDLIQCEDHGSEPGGDPGKAVWQVHRWKPGAGGAPPGFALDGEAIGPLATMRCDMALHTVDLDGDGKVELVVASVDVGGDGSEVASGTFDAVGRLEDGSWDVWDTGLPTVESGGRVVFLDVNGDGSPDAVESGFQDGALYTYVNTGRSFATTGVLSLGERGLGGQDAYFHLATVLDHNGDGRQDLLVPMPPEELPAVGERPVWVVLQANGGMQADATFTRIEANLPFEPALGEAVTLADPHGPRTGDLTGDGASDVLLSLAGELHVFESVASDPDVLTAITDGLNAHDPGEAGYLPSVGISYGPLIDASITKGLTAGDPALEKEPYLSRSDAANDCAYPRRCAVGPRRVVRGYVLNDGDGGERHFEVRYRDGRSHQLGGGFLGFAERIVVDLDTLAQTADSYDNVTFDAKRGVFPFAGQLRRRWVASPGLPSQPDPDEIELSFLEVTLTQVATNEGKTYFVLPTQSHLRRAQGVFSPGPGGAGLEAYARGVEQGGGGATWLRDTTAKVTDFDDFGHVRSEEIGTAGVDFTLRIDRTFENDTDRWVLGRLRKQRECSTAAMQSQCRTLSRTHTAYGEVESESIATDDGSPETKLDVVYGRDGFGNVTSITADDAFGHHRSSSIAFDAEGVFPIEHVNPEKHATLTAFDAELGVLTRYTDPNGLVTEWKHDSLGRPAVEIRPDGTTTTFTFSRTKDGGLAKDAWRVRQRVTTTGGADDEVEWDSLGREVRRAWHGPSPAGADGEPPRVMQRIAYDRWSGHVARRSVPVREDTDDAALLFDVFEYDALGREIRHATPWNAVTTTSYDGLLVKGTDPLGHVTTEEQDALGRRLTVTDAAQGITAYSYGPFGWLFTVTDPGGALTRTTRDALGRVRKVEDPDRGTTLLVHDGFGDLVSSTDALGRVVTFERDGLGRTTARMDQLGAEVLSTTWTWDTAAHGIGKLEQLSSPDGVKTYGYDALGRLERLALDVNGQGETMVGKLGYDGLGRVETLDYPRPAGMPAFAVKQEHDAYGHVLKVRDANSPLVYWQLTDVDGAGRIRREAFGNGTTTERAYDDARQRLKSLATSKGATKVQRLEYTFDALLDLASRTDELQPTHRTERFRYDALERLTCAYFSLDEDPAAPCAASYTYAPDGNLTSKTDVGILTYGDPAHPHAVTAADGGNYGYDAVGHQISRPGGVTVTYTPFDLPRTITEGASTVTLGYDGDERRVRKITPESETLYFSDWYERLTPMGGGATEHRYHVHSPERVVAVVTRGGASPGTLYLHADHLGSVDAITGDDGAVVERRSYDAFGQRRNPTWGEPPPASFPNETTLGFTGHESDGELGLVNMRGRVFDPKLGRFLTTDPILSDLSFGQAFNPYSYVLNNPLTYTDPSGFDADPDKPPILPIRTTQHTGPDGSVDVHLYYPPRGAPPKDTGEKTGVAVPATDTDTTGSAPPETDPGEASDPSDSPEPDDWTQSPYVQTIGAFWGGIGLGIVPFAGTGHQLLTDGHVLGRGSPEARRGLAVGQVVGGIFSMVGGVTGEILGGLATTTGIGAALGVPAIVVSTTLVLGGAANIWAGLQGLTQSMMSSGSPPAAKGSAKVGQAGGEGAGRGFPKSVKEQARAESRDTCVFCGKKTGTESGPTKSEIDHAIPKSRGGNNNLENAQNACRTCNRQKGAQTTEEFQERK